MHPSQKVTFLSRGIKIAADLYVPIPSPNIKDRKKAAVIVGHQGTGVKEQASGLYAQYLASQGFVSLAFDAAYQGESEGMPRGLEDPSQRVEDIKCAVTFLSAFDIDLVDPSRIGFAGICASGGYGIHAAATDPRIKAIAGISAMCFGAVTREGFRGQVTREMEMEKLQHQLAEAARAREEEAKGNPAPVNNISDLFSHPTEKIREYYNSAQWKHPRCTNEMAARSMELLVTYDSFQYLEWISPRPLLLVVGSEASTLPFSQTIFSKAKEPKELFIVKGKGHVNLYEDASQSGPVLAEFLGKVLCI